MATCLIALGSNLGDRGQTLERALKSLAQQNTRIIARSQWYQTPPVGGPPGQGDFLNGAITVETSLAPEELHAALKDIERSCGRQSTERWAARTLDLDLLLYDDLVLDTPRLTVPHPRMAFRRFVLAPAAEIAAGMVHPIIGWTIGELLDHIDRARPYVAVTGLSGAGQLELAQALVRQLGGQLLPDRASAASRLPGDDDDEGLHAHELAIIQERAALLDEKNLPEDGSLVASPFWFDESLAYAEVYNSESDRKHLKEALLRLQRSVVRPRLVVFLDPPLDYLSAHALAGSTAPSKNSLERLRRALWKVLRRPDVGPVLHAESTDPSQVLAEVIAAGQAMCDQGMSVYRPGDESAPS